MYALVLDGELKSALTAVRSLGRAGRKVSVGSTRGSAMAGFSRFSSDHFVYPDPKIDQDKFVAHIIKAAKRFPEPPVLFTFSDATYLTVFAYRKELMEHCLIVLPEMNAVTKAFDKAETYTLARMLGIPTVTEYEYNPASVVSFPVVVKPKTSVSWATGEGKYGTAEIVFDAASYLAAAEAVEAQTGQSPIVQEFIMGSEYGVECLAFEGEVSKVFVHKRIRSQSPRGGAATVKTTVLNDPHMVAMVSHSKKLIAELAWTGPIMVEWKFDTKEGVAKLMEINGRFWGSLPLPERVGVQFVLGYDVLARGFAAPKSRPIRPLTTQHFLGDVRWLWRVMTANDPLRAELYPHRLLALGSFLKTTLSVPGDVWSVTDPLPFFMEYIDVIKKYL